MKRILAIMLAFTALALSAPAQEKASIDISAKSPSGMIDPMLY